MNEVIEKIITAGTMAPSGENCQPWRFEVRHNDILLYNLPDRDRSLYSWGQRASCIAHGALLMNMEVTAKALGYSLDANLFPDRNNPDLVATIGVKRTERPSGGLETFIPQRTTNRKPYKKYDLTQTEKEDLVYSQVELETKARLILIEDKQTVSELGLAAGINEKILFENEILHRFFFSHINWNIREDEQKSIGFYIKTLELPPPIQAAFRLFKHWGIQRLLNKIGFSKLIAAGNGKLYGSSSAFGSIIIDNQEPEQYVETGKLLQLVWLKLTKHGLVLQPLTGVLFLMLKIKSGETKELSEEHISLIKNTYEKIQKLLGTEKTVAMMFRIGKADSPSAKSSRLKPGFA